MSTKPNAQILPLYQTFIDSIAPLAIPFSGSELHGIMCGYLATGAISEGVAYLRTLISDLNDPVTRPATIALFQLFTITQQQIEGLGFEFQLLLVDEQDSLERRALSFSDWCEGFIHGIQMTSVDYNELDDEDTQDALQHITEFSNLDYHELQFEEDNEHALLDITEYTRMAVLHIHSDSQMNPRKPHHSDNKTAH